VRLRDTETDLGIFEQIFLLDDCFVPWPMKGIRYIIDAGAHIGCSSLYFAARYPEARILAVEADPRNHHQLVLNTSSVPNITPLHGAVFYQTTSVVIANPEDRPWGFQVEASSDTATAKEGMISAHTIPDLMAVAAFPHIDLLKIDIEGAEREVFENGGAEWLRHVRIMIVELHDNIKPGCSASFHRATASIPHEIVRHLNNSMWRNQGPFG